MKYIAFLDQGGGGCDYSIGCGMVSRVIEAKDSIDALNELKKYIIGFNEDAEDATPETWELYWKYGDGYWNNEELYEVHLFPLDANIEVPLKEWYSTEKQRLEEKELEEKESEERALYKQLKSKYGWIK